MEFNEIKDMLNHTKAPNVRQSVKNKSGKTQNIADFIEDLKAGDIRNLKLIRRFKIMYVIAVVFYILLFIVNPDKGLTWQERLIGICFIGALLIYVYYFQNSQKNYLVQYLDKPTTEFLQEAEMRYRYWNRKSIILIFPFLLIDGAATFSFFANYYSVDKSLFSGIFISQLVFLSICIISFWLGKIMWKKKNGLIYENINILIDSFSNNASNS